MRQTSPAVYRRRRLVFFSALILVVVLIAAGVWLAIAQPWKSSEAPAPAPTSSAPSTPEAPTSPETPAGDESPAPDQSENPVAAPCRGTDIAVEAVTDSDSYPAGVLPALSISLTNNGASACTLDVGSATQVFTVTSGTDVWWRSTDCQENPSSMVVTLDAGQNVTSAEPVVWDRTRSDVSTCGDENRPRAPAGGASYHVGVSIGGFESLDTQQILLY